MSQQLIEEGIHQLVVDFYENSTGFFSEEELHGQFFAICRPELGTTTTTDGKVIHLFRHEYNSIWRYADEDEYREIYTEQGSPLSIDFAVLRRAFVETHGHLSVVNKDDTRRARLRTEAGTGAGRRSPAMEIGIEFKMAHLRSSSAIQEGQITGFSDLMLKDCRKLAHERVGLAYVLGFSHGPRPTLGRANEIADECVAEFGHYFPDGQVNVLVVSPQVCVRRGEWIVDLPAPPLPPVAPAATDEPTPAAPPTRGMEYLAPDADGRIIRVRVCCVRELSSRVYPSDLSGESFVVANDALEPVADQTEPPRRPRKGEEYILSGQEGVRVTIDSPGDCNSWVETADTEERIFVANHKLLPVPTA